MAVSGTRVGSISNTGCKTCSGYSLPIITAEQKVALFLKTEECCRVKLFRDTCPSIDRLDFDDPRFQQFVNMTTDFTKVMASGLPADFIAWLRFFPSSKEKEIVKMMKKFMDYMDDQLKERHNNFQSGRSRLRYFVGYNQASLIALFWKMMTILLQHSFLLPFQMDISNSACNSAHDSLKLFTTPVLQIGRLTSIAPQPPPTIRFVKMCKVVAFANTSPVQKYRIDLYCKHQFQFML